jgi:hypothetical protein
LLENVGRQTFNAVKFFGHDGMFLDQKASRQSGRRR